MPTTLDAARATFLKLGSGSTPIDLIYAFDSIWVANHHSNDVSRIDPGTVTQIARIPAGSGPGWFAATDDAIWVSNQNGVGVTRIDPATNQAVASIGNLPPCGPLGVAAGFVWQSACFSGRYVKIDPATNNAEELDSEGHGDFVAVGDVLYTGVGPGVALFDARTGEFTEIGGCCGLPIGFDGTAVWLSDETATVSRVDVATGEVVATLSLPAARAVAVRDGRAWVTAGREGVVEVDLESNERLRALEILPSPVVVRDAGGALWVTEQANHAVWRVEP